MSLATLMLFPSRPLYLSLSLSPSFSLSGSHILAILAWLFLASHIKRDGGLHRLDYVGK